ncbi:hypothetical protein D3C86_1434370 [compost metagenome]
MGQVVQSLVEGFAGEGGQTRQVEGGADLERSVGQGLGVAGGEGQGQIAFQHGLGHSQSLRTARGDGVARGQDGRQDADGGRGQGDGLGFALDGANDVRVARPAAAGDQGGAGQGRIGGGIGAGLARAFAAIDRVGDGAQGVGQGFGRASGQTLAASGCGQVGQTPGGAGFAEG